MTDTQTTHSRLTGAYGRALLVARTKAGLSQREAKARTGYGLSSIGRYERGERSMDIDDLEVFARVYGTTLAKISAIAEEVNMDATFVWPPVADPIAVVVVDVDVITASELGDQEPGPRER